MQRSLLVIGSLFLLLSLPIMLLGQTSGQFGLKGGLNVSTLGGKESGYSAKLGYHAGLYVEKQYYQEIGVTIELLVSLQGARVQGYDELKLNYTYLTLPIMANIYFAKGASVDLGLQGGYLLRAIQKDGGNKIDISEDVNKGDLGGIVGLSYLNHVRIGVRYVLGISNSNGTFFTFSSNSKNNVLQIYVAIPLKLFK